MTTDVVCVLDSSLSQVFATARPLKATIKEDSKPMEHPLETGGTVTDHRIIQPVEIELAMILTGEDYAGVFQQIRELFYRGDLLTVQTNTGSYPSMMIQAIPHEESPDAYDAVNVGLTLKEVVFVSAQFADIKVPAHKADARTVPRGEQQPQASKKQSSILSGLFR